MAKTNQDGYVKPRSVIDAKIKNLEFQILDNSRITIHQKRDMIAWRDALKWVTTREQKAWEKRMKEVEKHDKDAGKRTAARDDGEAGRQISETE